MKKNFKDSLNLFFKYCYIPHSHCIYDNVFKLEASTILEIDASSKQINKGKIRKETYWEPKLQKKYKEFSKEDFLVEIENKLSNSVNQQMRSDVPLGSFLSGGIDSSLISCLMQKNSSKKLILLMSNLKKIDLMNLFLQEKFRILLFKSSRNKCRL